MTRIRHRVEMVGQGSSPVCWMACAMMLYKFKFGQRFENLTLYGFDPTISTVNTRSSTIEIERELSLRSWGFRLAGTADMRSYLRQMREPPRNRAESVTSLRATTRTGGERERDSTRIEPATSLRATPRNRSRRAIHESTVQTIIFILQNFGPFILNHKVGTINYGVVSTPTTDGLARGHTIVITGIDTSRNVIYFNNPWGETASNVSAQHVDVPAPIEMVVKAIEYWERNQPANCFVYLP